MITCYGQWKLDEIERFSWACQTYGPDFDRIAESVGTRNVAMCKMRYHRDIDASDWNEADENLFIEGVRKFGSSAYKICKLLPTKTKAEVSKHIALIR